MPKRRRDEESDSSDSDDDSEVQQLSLTPNTKLAGDAELPRLPSKYTYNNKQRVLVIASRGITARYRHLLEDLKKMIPHHKTDSKLDDKGDVHAVNEIAEVKSCNQILYLETRKHSDLYLYVGRTPNGPSAKFQVVNVHTMDELKLTGNCMLGSRPLLDFDSAFDRAPHLQLMKAMLTDTFGTPLGHPKTKPFLDRIMCFFLVKNNIWVRNYQIVDSSETSKEQGTTLVEIGPRFVLIPIRIFMGSLGGPTLYQNMSYVTPNTERSIAKKAKGNRYAERVQHGIERKQFLEENQMPRDELSSKNVFADEDDDNEED
jgi:ribosome biogenesis protein BRX1